MFLTDTEIADLTQRRRRDAQARALAFMGIEHKRRPDGSLAVLRAHVEQVLGGPASSGERRMADAEPDWSASGRLDDAHLPRRLARPATQQRRYLCGVSVSRCRQLSRFCISLCE